MIILATALAMANVDGPKPQVDIPDDPAADADYCDAMRILANRMGTDLPITVDPTTRIDSFQVQCLTKIVAWNKTINVTTSSLDRAWRAGIQAQWNTTVCANAVFKSMRSRDWHFLQNLTFSNGERATIDSQPCL